MTKKDDFELPWEQMHVPEVELPEMVIDPSQLKEQRNTYLGKIEGVFGEPNFYDPDKEANIIVLIRNLAVDPDKYDGYIFRVYDDNRNVIHETKTHCNMIRLSPSGSLESKYGFFLTGAHAANPNLPRKPGQTGKELLKALKGQFFTFEQIPLWRGDEQPPSPSDPDFDDQIEKRSLTWRFLRNKDRDYVDKKGNVVDGDDRVKILNPVHMIVGPASDMDGQRCCLIGEERGTFAQYCEVNEIDLDETGNPYGSTSSAAPRAGGKQAKQDVFRAYVASGISDLLEFSEANFSLGDAVERGRDAAMDTDTVRAEVKEIIAEIVPAKTEDGLDEAAWNRVAHALGFRNGANTGWRGDNSAEKKGFKAKSTALLKSMNLVVKNKMIVSSE